MAYFCLFNQPAECSGPELKDPKTPKPPWDDWFLFDWIILWGETVLLSVKKHGERVCVKDQAYLRPWAKKLKGASFGVIFDGESNLLLGIPLGPQKNQNYLSEARVLEKVGDLLLCRIEAVASILQPKNPNTQTRGVRYWDFWGCLKESLASTFTLSKPSDQTVREHTSLSAENSDTYGVLTTDQGDVVHNIVRSRAWQIRLATDECGRLARFSLIPLVERRTTCIISYYLNLVSRYYN